MFSNFPRIRQALTPVALAIVSLIAALALWVAVTDAENPTTVKELPFTIPVVPVGVEDGLAVYTLTPDSVVVTVRATDDTLEELTASNFRATVTLTGVRDSQTTQNIVVEVVGVDEEEVSLVETTSRFTRAILETEVTKTVPVQVNRLGTLAQGFTITETSTSPEEVTVIGPASYVDLVRHADADVNLTGVRSNLQRVYELTPRDAGDAIQPRVQVQPSTAEVSMTVQQQETPQVVPVVVDTQGTPAYGYNIISVRPDPVTVLVTGSLQVLQSLDFLATETIDLSGLNGTVTRPANLQVPAGVAAERQSVSVTIEVEPAPGQRAITVAPTVINVPPGLNAVLQTSSLSVRISGLQLDLDELTAADFRATIDASGLTEGTHSLPVRVEAPDFVMLDAVEPAQAVIALRP
jgi:YbbR domain-containing protein